MRRFLIPLFLALCPTLAQAWNAAGHRLIAVIAWQQLSPGSRSQISTALARHPDFPRWQEKARPDNARDVFAEAATWADSIRHDPRYYDEGRQEPTEAIAGLPDHARHKNWHYLDLDAAGHRRAGEIDRRIGKIELLLRLTARPEQISWALPWLLHLVGDIHQPLHVGRYGDEGGNRVQIENPARRQPFFSLHQYWDDLPGASSLRGKRLDQRANELLSRHAAPVQGNVATWRDESHRLLDFAYPTSNGSLLPLVDTEFAAQAERIGEQRVVAAGFRLGRLLEDIFAQRVPRETP